MAGDLFHNPRRKLHEDSLPIFESFVDMNSSVFCAEHYPSLPYVRHLYGSLYPYGAVACCWTCNIKRFFSINPLKPELNPICYLLALLGAHHFLHVSRIRFKLLTFMLLMSYIYIYIYIYMEHPFLMFLDHTQRRSTVGRTPLDE